MKIILLLITTVFFWVNVFSQTIVSTTPENKNAIIEEFTGIACGFCPYGHLEVAQFIAAHPGDGFSIAFHQGYYAIPDPGQPNYMTTYGDGLGGYFTVSGWPNALINRHDFGAGLLYPLNEWQQYASQVLTEGAYVNIACEAEVDVQTRELTVHVEAYYTGNSPESTNYLNVALVQNNVKGPQFSSWFNPDAITPDGEYMHQHMFRDFLTGQWGEELSPTTSGTFIDEYFTFTIPDDFNDVPVHLGDIGIVSYISETEEEVANVHGCEPTLTNFEYDIDAGIDIMILPEASCSNVKTKLVVGNYCSENISSINFEKIIQSRTKHIAVILEDIFQPHNASAVLRTCDCFGIQDIHIIENKNIYEVNPDVALGSSKWLNLYKYNSTDNNTIEAFNSLREKGYRIVATTPHENDCLLEELNLDSKIALVFGTELEGLSEIAINNADEFVKIPMYGFTESFNISVSAAIILHYLTEKLKKSNINWELSEKEKTDIELNWVKNVVKRSDLLEEEFLKNL